MKSMAWQATPTPVLDLLPSLLTTKTNRPLQEAINYAETNFGHALDRERFIAEARNRIAERIAEGRTGAPQKEDPDRQLGGRSR